MGERMGKAERIEIEDFVQNIVERMETPEAFEKMISREEECEAQGRESRLRDVLKKEWPVDEKGERIYQITNIYEEKAEELASTLEEKYPDCEVEVNNGGQPIYYYIISVE